VENLLALTDITLALLSFVFAFYLRHGEAIVHRTRAEIWSGARVRAVCSAVALVIRSGCSASLLRSVSRARRIVFVEDAGAFSSYGDRSLLIVAAASCIARRHVSHVLLLARHFLS